MFNGEKVKYRNFLSIEKFVVSIIDIKTQLRQGCRKTININFTN